MKITKVDLIFCQPVEDGWRPSFCRIYTDKGIYGDGEVALPYGSAKEAAFNEMKDLAPMLIGMNSLRARSNLAEALSQQLLWLKRRPRSLWRYFCL